MKKTTIKILIFSAVYLIAVYLINAVFIRPGIIRVFGNVPSEKIFQEAFVGVFAAVNLLLPAFFTMFWRIDLKNIKKLIVFSGIYLLLTLLTFMFFVMPGFSLVSILIYLVILFSFMLFTFALEYFFASFAMPKYFKSLIVVVIVFSMITSVLWMNPIYEHVSSDSETLKPLVTFGVTINPAIISIEGIYNINMFRSGNFYSHSGGTGLSLIGDYYGSIDYFKPIILYSLIYISFGLLFFIPAFLIRKFRKQS